MAMMSTEILMTATMVLVGTDSVRRDTGSPGSEIEGHIELTNDVGPPKLTGMREQTLEVGRSGLRTDVQAAMHVCRRLV
jgi:hypothetical protein